MLHDSASGTSACDVNLLANKQVFLLTIIRFSGDLQHRFVTDPSCLDVKRNSTGSIGSHVRTEESTASWNETDTSETCGSRDRVIRCHKSSRASAVQVLAIVVGLGTLNSLASDAPLQGLLTPAEETTFCASCFPKRYRVRVGVHWADKVDLDTWLVLPTQQRPEDPDESAIWYDHDVHVLPGQVDTDNGADSAGWLDFDEQATRPRARYAEEILVGWNPRGASAVAYPRTWCVLIDYWGPKNLPKQRDISAIVEIETGASQSHHCELHVPTTSPDSPNIPTLLQVCDGALASTRELAVALITERADGEFDFKAGEGWSCHAN